MELLNIFLEVYVEIRAARTLHFRFRYLQQFTHFIAFLLHFSFHPLDKLKVVSYSLGITLKVFSQAVLAFLYSFENLV